MSQPLPVSNFKWMTESQLEKWREIFSQEGCGCILEVDLEYPKELHNDYHLAPERIVVNMTESHLENWREIFSQEGCGCIRKNFTTIILSHQKGLL